MKNILKLKENVFLMTVSKESILQGTIDIQCLKCVKHGSIYRRNPVACQGSIIQNQECLVQCFYHRNIMFSRVFRLKQSVLPDKGSNFKQMIFLPSHEYVIWSNVP